MFGNSSVSPKNLFLELYKAPTEKEVDALIQNYPDVFDDKNWKPLGNNYSNYGVIENQQSSPIAALVEKITNSIDAILMKRCYEEGIDPKSDKAPKTVEEAVKQFFPNQSNWDLPKFRKEQSENIQILADGPPRNTSVIIYDDGEGQHPEDFEASFLSLLRGNKNEIHFVQGKYNMGGSGAIVFSGKKGYQLIASKKFDNTGKFGFTIVREHPLNKQEEKTKKNTWYEYLVIDDKIPAFEIDELDLNLKNRKFKTGTIIKLYSYQFPPGYSGFAQDLNQSINEFLFEPALPVLTVDKKERYPNNIVLDLDLYGLKRRLEKESNDYVDQFFSEEYQDELFGLMKVTCYVFKAKFKKHDVKKSKDVLRERFFRNTMSVLFSINGQVHGHYTSEFVTRALKFNLLKDYLLIHVDCTQMKYSFRKELFMASRDRLKQGEEVKQLRDFLATKLKKSQLDEINKQRKSSIGLESEDTNELIKSFAKNLPKNSDLMKLLSQTLKLEEPKKPAGKHPKKENQQKREEKPFLPQRFPSMFQLRGKKGEGTPTIKVPLGGEKTILFESDVEDQYFDRTEEPGNLKLTLLGIKRDKRSGGNMPGTDREITDVLNIVKSSPNKGNIKITINPTKEINVGDELEVKVSLNGTGPVFEEHLFVKISDPEAPKEKIPQKSEEETDFIGLPELVKVKEEQWQALEEGGVTMNRETVMFPFGDGEKLEKIYINIDSHVFLSYRSNIKNISEDQIHLAEKRYLSSVYFHTLFLYMITKNRKYKISLEKDGEEEEKTVSEYLKDVFDSYYSDFLLNFGMEQLISSLDES